MNCTATCDVVMQHVLGHARNNCTTHHVSALVYLRTVPLHCTLCQYAMHFKPPISISVLQVVQSYVGGDGFVALCWVLRCGQQDLDVASMANILRPSKDYNQEAYMGSMQLARKPAASGSAGFL